MSVATREPPRSGWIAPHYLPLVFRLAHLLAVMAPVGPLIHILGVEDRAVIDRTLALALSGGLLCILLFQSSGMYSRDLFGNQLLIKRTLLGWSTVFGLLLLGQSQLNYLIHVPPLLELAWFASSLLLFGLVRLLLLLYFRHMMRQGRYLQRAVILGCTDNGVRLARYMREHGDVRHGLLGFIDDRARERLPQLDDSLPPMLGDSRTLERMIREERIDQVLLALPWSADSRHQYFIDRLRRLPVSVMVVPDITAFNYARTRITTIGGVAMLNVADLPLEGWSPVLKRAEDVILASVLLLLLAPLMLLVALAIRLDSPGPVLFRQRRYGYNEHLIRVYKFRSMYHHLADQDASRQTSRQDARVTRVGRFIRKTSLDELPQLLNVLGGSMSLVGPRPHATATRAAGILFEEAVAEYSARHRVKPGITGLAQIHGCRGETDTLEKIERRVEYDLQYIETWSLALDLRILLKTVPAVLATHQVY
ncbi:undecaprenyl-phosphate glucose phosphotransferase [Frateuria aurantia]